MRVKITLACTECKQRNYNTMKNKKNSPDRLEMNKYCRFCKKHTLTGAEVLCEPFENIRLLSSLFSSCFCIFRLFLSHDVPPLFCFLVKSEIKKITWPTAKQTTKNFGIVIAMVAIVGVFIFALDQGLYALVGLFMNTTA